MANRSIKIIAWFGRTWFGRLLLLSLLGFLMLVAREVYHARVMRNAAARLVSAGAKVSYFLENQTDPAIPRFLRENCGLDCIDFVIHVELNDTKVTEDDLSDISTLEQLVGLELNDTNIQDSDVEWFVGLGKLWALRLRNTPITDAALERLQRVHSLGLLDVRGTAVTADGCRELQTAIPDLLILR